jgi:endonuclease/exonuclease/phosphatase family metal-dependent hydrolase
MENMYHRFDTTRPYHMDFVFVPTDWRLRCVEVGTFEEYVEPRRSDHVPVVVSIDPEIVAPAR